MWPHEQAMKSIVTRREMLRHVVVLSGSLVAPALLLACSRKPSCLDVTGLSPEDVRARTDTAGYTDVATDPAKKCNVCAHWVPAPSATACGGCKVVKGPINPEGGCKLFVPKSAA
jgi:hypothetical protein